MSPSSPSSLSANSREGRLPGLLHYTASAIIESHWAGQRLTATPLIRLQAQYSFVAREIEAEIIPACERHGLGMLDRPGRPGTLAVFGLAADGG